MIEHINKPHFSRNYVYLKIDTLSFVNDLKTAVVEIAFTRPDGTPGFTRGTLQPTYFGRGLTENEKQTRADYLAGKEKQVEVIHVWSVDQNDWVSIRLDRIISCQLTSG